MKRSIKKKVNGIGLAGRIISTIMVVLMSAACFGLLVGGVVLAVLPREAVTVGVRSDLDVNINKDLFGPNVQDLTDEEIAGFNAEMNVNGKEYVDMQMERTDNGLIIRGSTDNFRFDLSRLCWAAFTGLVYCAALLVAFIFLMRLSEAFHHCETPFDDLVIKRMNVFAWVLVGCAAAASVAEAIVNSLLQHSTDFSFALNPSDIGGGPDISINYAPILIALIVLFLTVVFRYGAQLQKESDETL